MRSSVSVASPRPRRWGLLVPLLAVMLVVPALAQEEGDDAPPPTEPPPLEAVPDGERVVDVYRRRVEYEQARFDAAVQAAMQQYQTSIQGHRVRLTRELMTVQATRTRAGDLDGAVAVREFLGYLGTMSEPVPALPRALLAAIEGAGGGGGAGQGDPLGPGRGGGVEASDEVGMDGSDGPLLDRGGVEPGEGQPAAEPQSRIVANKAWQTVGRFTRGQRVTMTFVGRWSGGSDPAFTSGPEGVADLAADETNPLPSAASFAVVGRFEGGTRVFPIGQSITFTAPTDCTLQAMINEDTARLDDNSGELTYIVEVE